MHLTDLLDQAGQCTGRGVRVALVDTGVEADHPAIQGRLLASFNAQSGADGMPIISPCEPGDAVGHGTAVAGQLLRIAPEAELISVRILGTDRAGTSEALIAALGWLTSQQIDLVNLSLSTQRLGLALRISQAIDGLWALGIPCVCAQGPSASLDFPRLSPAPSAWLPPSASRA